MMLLAAVLLALAAQEIPAQKGLVNDFAGVLDADSRDKVQRTCEGVLQGKKFALVVVTVKSLGGSSVEEFTVRLGNKWGIGQKKANNGVVFLLAMAEHKIRIENGYGVEAHLTDIESKQIIERIIVPRMKEGKTGEAVSAGAEALAARLGGAEIPAGLEVKPPEINVLMIVVIVIAIIVVLCILSAVFAGNPVAWVAAIAEASSSSSSSSSGSSSSSSNSGSGGGSFGGGGASGDW